MARKTAAIEHSESGNEREARVINLNTHYLDLRI